MRLGREAIESLKAMLGLYNVQGLNQMEDGRVNERQIDAIRKVQREMVTRLVYGVPIRATRTRVELDRLLTNVMLYWINGINAANWLYVSLMDGQARKLPPGTRVQVPTALMLMPNDLTVPAPRAWAERIFARLERFTLAPRGGHFPALECGDLLAEDVRAFFRGLR